MTAKCTHSCNDSKVYTLQYTVAMYMYTPHISGIKCPAEGFPGHYLCFHDNTHCLLVYLHRASNIRARAYGQVIQIYLLVIRGKKALQGLKDILGEQEEVLLLWLPSLVPLQRPSLGWLHPPGHIIRLHCPRGFVSVLPPGWWLLVVIAFDNRDHPDEDWGKRNPFVHDM